MDLELAQTVLYFLLGGFLIFLAITVVRDNFSSRLNRVTGAMLGFAGLGPIFVALGGIIDQSTFSVTRFEDSTLYHLHYFWEFFFPFLAVFSWVYPLDRFKEFRFPKLLYLVFIPQLIHLLLLIFFNDVSQILAALQIDPSQEGLVALILRPFSRLISWLMLLISSMRTYHATIFGSINLIYVLTSVYFFESGRRFLDNPRLLSQTTVVIWGMRIGLGLFVFAQLGRTVFQYTLSQEFVSVTLILALTAGAGFLIFATIRHQFLDVRLIFRQSFVYTISSGLLVGAYVVLVIQAKQFLTPVFSAQAEIVSYLFIILILLLFQPINAWLDNKIRSLFLRTRTDHRNVLERFSRQVISQFDPKHLRKIIDETLKTTLLVDKVYFVLFEDKVEEYVLLPETDEGRRIILARDDLMLRGINLLDQPTHINSLSDFSGGSQLSELLEERKIRMILPMKDAEHLLGFVAITDKITGYRFSSEDMSLLGVLSNQMVTALTNARLYVESLERIRLQEEVSMARQIQLDLLPSEPPTLACSDVYALSTPSRTVGGDFYDFIPLTGNRLGIVIADASGKGMPAALMIAQIQAMIRSELNSGNPIALMLKNVNEQVVQSSSSEKYVTLFYGELHLETGEFNFANAGHNYPILARTDGSIELLQEGGPIVGALPSMTYKSSSTRLQDGDFLFLFTDGLSEAMNEADEEYTEERIRNFIRDNRKESVTVMVEKILKDVRSHDATQPPQDDTTIIAIKMKNGNFTNG